MTEATRVNEDSAIPAPPAPERTSDMGEILAAISSAMGEVQKVAKLDENKHDKYAFASIDAFLTLVNPICARNGLVVLSDEKGREEFTRQGKYGETFWVRLSFSFEVYHVSGQRLPPMQRSVEVIRSGAQAYGSAQSYCLKQFFRGLLLIPTGDKDDPDFQNALKEDSARSAPPFSAQAAADRIVTRINRAADLGGLQGVWGEEAQTIAQIKDASAEAYGQINAAKNQRKAQLAEAPATDLGDDSIPY